MLLFEPIGTNTRLVAETTTGRSGKYAFKGVPIGDYILTAEKEGYISASEEVTVREPSSGSPFNLRIHLYPELREALWGGVNNGDIFDEPGPIIDEMLDQLAKANLRVLRVIIDYRLEMDEWGNPLPDGVYNDCILTWIDRLMLEAREKGILLLITLQMHNWIIGDIHITQENYEWRKCKTPFEIFQIAKSTGELQIIKGPYYNRGWSGNYLTSAAAKKAYKDRVYHILNHYNYFLNTKWKDINDVVWAWGLQSEPEFLPDSSDGTVLQDWFDEMATYVKSIDPDTYVALGTRFAGTAIELGNIEDADIYTFHPYAGISILDKEIQDFQEKIGKPYGKLLLAEEFNPGAEKRHTPDYPEYRAPFEEIMEVCRRNGVPWMFWEHGYYFDEYNIWHADGVTSENDTEEEHIDGVFWGAKVLPGAKRIWQTSWDWGSVGKPWKVHTKVDNICFANPACDTGMLYFIDTFSGGQLSSEYEIFDEGTKDSYFITTGSPSYEYGYLRIEADKWQDLWGGAFMKTGAPLVLHEVSVLKDQFDEPYSVETFVSADPLLGLNAKPLQPLNTQMGLFVFQDVDNWIFFGLTHHDFTIGGSRVQGDGLIVAVTYNGVSSIVGGIEEYAEDFVFLRIDKLGRSSGGGYRFSWKRENGEPWHTMMILNLKFKDHKVGMGVKTLDVFPDPGYPGQANFDYFLIGSP
jgi:hypothetical protein